MGPRSCPIPVLIPDWRPVDWSASAVEETTFAAQGRLGSFFGRGALALAQGEENFLFLFFQGMSYFCHVLYISAEFFWGSALLFSGADPLLSHAVAVAFWEVPRPHPGERVPGRLCGGHLSVDEQADDAAHQERHAEQDHFGLLHISLSLGLGFITSSCRMRIRLGRRSGTCVAAEPSS
jgi:hypothetical protein